MRILKAFIRISLLLLMVLLGFTIVMPGWYHNLDIIKSEVGSRFLDNAELVERESKQHKEDNIQSEARATGQSADDIRKREFDSKVRWQRMKKLEEFARTNQAAALSSLLSTTAESDLPNELFQSAIESGSRDSFKVLLASDINCDWTSAHGGRAFDHATRTGDSYYLKAMIASGCSLEHNQYRKPLTTKILDNRKPALLLEIPITKANYSDFRAAFESAIKNKDSDLALAFIDHGISQRTMSQNLRASINNKLNLLTLQMMDRGADFSVDSLGHGSSILRHAIGNGDKNVVAEILKRDPDHIRREQTKHDDLLYTALNYNEADTSQELVSFLFANGLSVDKFESGGIAYLVDSIKRPRPTLLKQLIEHGAEPKALYHGRSLIEVAKQFPSDSSTEILNILKKNGVAETGLAFAKASENLKANRKCDFDKADYDFSSANPQIQTLAGNAESGTQIQRCEALILSCRKSGQSLDSCIYSAPVCDSNGTSKLCCESTFKSVFTEARCAGLPSEHAAYRIEGLTTQYKVPIILADPNRRSR